MLEREVKLLFPTTAAAREAVLAAGAVPADALRLQDDSLYDLPDDTFRKKGCVVRIRVERWTDRPDTTTLTVKGPVQSSQMKLREEQRLEWVAITEERHRIESAEEREAAKALAATRLPKGTVVMNTLTGVRGVIAGVGKHGYKVVRPGGSYVKAPHENWEAIQ